MAESRGFALMITVLLLAFLVLLLVSLASLTRVETQVAGNSQSLAKARQNAVVALNLALGKLQQTAGPDQRATATADLFYQNSGLATADQTHLSKRHWTGVWTTTRVAASTPAPANADNSLTNNTAPVWLVSEATPDRKTAAPSLPLTQNYSATAVRLVGAKSAYLTDSDSDNIDDLGNSVVLTLQDINIPASSVPALGSTAAGNAMIGRYAWWIGDEGVKAKISVEDKRLNSAVANERRWRSMVSPRLGGEYLSGESDPQLTPTSYVGSAFKPDQAGHMLSPKQLLLMGSTPAEITTLQTALKNRFHDVTAYGYGVLADIKQGGLKKDLTAGFAPGTDKTTAPRGNRFNASSGRIFEPPTVSYLPSSSTITTPLWQTLRSYYQLQFGSGLSGTSPTEVVQPRSTTDEQMGVFPVMTRVQLDFRIVRDAASRTVDLLYAPELCLWNPYNITIAGATYTFRVGFRPDRKPETRKWSPTWPTNKIPSVGVQLYSDATTNSTSFLTEERYEGPLDEDGIEFIVTVPNLPPGETYVFSPPNPGSYGGAEYVSGSSRLEKGQNQTYVWQRVATVSTPGNINALRIAFPFARQSFAELKLSGGTVVQRIEGNDFPALNVSSTSHLSHTTPASPAMVQDSSGMLKDIAIARPGNFLTSSNALHHRFNQTIRDLQQLSAGTTTMRLLADFNPAASAVGAPIGNRANYIMGPLIFRTPGVILLASSGDPARVNIGTGGGGATDKMVLYHLPRENTGVTSLGALQHAVVHPKTGIYSDHIHGINPDIVNYTNNVGMASGYLTGGIQRYRGFTENAPYYDNANAAYGYAPEGTPAYVIGNSLASPFVASDQMPAWKIHPGAYHDLPGGEMAINLARVVQYDLSYLLNDALWDGFFFSTVKPSQSRPAGSGVQIETTDFPLPNSRLIPYASEYLPDTIADRSVDLLNYDHAAARLLVDGAFNVNSTSVDAWRAVLSSPLGVRILNDSGGLFGTAGSQEVPYPRLPHAQTGEFDSASHNINSTNNLALAGYRSLTRDQINSLAKQIVVEIKDRAVRPERLNPADVAPAGNDTFTGTTSTKQRPFFSLSEFVNRDPLSDILMPSTGGGGGSSVNTENGGASAYKIPPSRLAGALQTAIDRTTINDRLQGWNGSGAPDLIVPTAFSSNDRPAFSGTWPNRQGGWTLLAQHTRPKSVPSGATFTAGNSSSRANSVPGFLTQADVLQALGPVLATRSDTFVIRTYGEAVNPVLSTAGQPAVEARAWLEAVVQRVPDYVEAAVSADANPANGDAAWEKPTAGTNNEKFGRRFKIISFRWLSNEDI